MADRASLVDWAVAVFGTSDPESARRRAEAAWRSTFRPSPHEPTGGDWRDRREHGAAPEAA